MNKERKNPILRVEDLKKKYGGLLALDNVHLDVNYKEVHAVVGENGAGKSTLMNILGGIVKRDEGEVYYKGEKVDFASPLESIEAGIAVIHQELSMLPSLNVIENVFMGRMDNRFGCVRWSNLEKKTASELKRVGLEIDPYTLVKDLSISQRQLIEIAKTLSMNASLIIMDEPNSSLTTTETEKLFKVIEDVKQSGVTIIYVSHKIEEVLRISDRISVLRDGRYIGTKNKEEATVDTIIQMMVGRELMRKTIHNGHKIGDVLLEVCGLTGKSFHDISFKVHEGEIVGFAGLVGAGRSELMRAIFGADPFASGSIIFKGKPVKFKSPYSAIENGMAMLPEDRRNLSLFMEMSIGFNISIAQLPRMIKRGIIIRRKVFELVNEFIRKLNIKLNSIHNQESSLSGGNQQKTVLARWLATNPKLLILDEPTHGIDVGTKAEIYRLMHNLTRQGIGIILVSSELPEIMMMSDRIIVMRDGYITGILDKENITKDSIMALATYDTHKSTK